MIEWILARPLHEAVLFLTGVAAVRSQSTYWLGRGIHAGVIRTRWAKGWSGERSQVARAKLERWGWPLIPLSFLTIGFQTAVNLTSGLIAWHWLRYTLAASIGWLAWGLIYACGGLAIFNGLVALAQHSPWLAASALLALALLITTAVLLWRRGHAAPQADQAGLLRQPSKSHHLQRTPNSPEPTQSAGPTGPNKPSALERFNCFTQSNDVSSSAQPQVRHTTASLQPDPSANDNGFDNTSDNTMLT
ncbi:MAG: hypothetical protein LBV30_03505 [Propionibacteriaceae bacterium]|jgi:membrane protein DedA with SNARE-associated domain|nr:hypothetical protein [Propionibacteriaceae bacterium]